MSLTQYTFDQFKVKQAADENKEVMEGAYERIPSGIDLETLLCENAESVSQAKGTLSIFRDHGIHTIAVLIRKCWCTRDSLFYKGERVQYIARKRIELIRAQLAQHNLTLGRKPIKK